MAGDLTPADILELQDEDSHNPDEIRRKLGFTGNLEDVQVSKDAYHAFVELHIEQGPVLSKNKYPSALSPPFLGLQLCI